MRQGFDEYMLEVATVVATRTTCTRHQVGAVLVRDKHILATGYNGAPKGLPHCNEIGCIRDESAVGSATRLDFCRGTHAEMNAITHAAAWGVPIAGSTLYCTHRPCSICARLLINAGIKRVVYQQVYPDELAVQMFYEAGVQLDKGPGADLIFANKALLTAWVQGCPWGCSECNTSLRQACNALYRELGECRVSKVSKHVSKGVGHIEGSMGE